MESPRIFISYSHSDSAWAKAFADQLAKRDLSLWFDQWSIKPGEDWREAIGHAIRESEVILLLINPDSVESPNLFLELGAAMALNKRIIPIVSEEVDRSKIPVSLLQIQYFVRSTPEETAEQVASAVASE